MEGEREAWWGQVAYPRMKEKFLNLEGLQAGVGVTTLNSTGLREGQEGTALLAFLPTELSASHHSLRLSHWQGPWGTYSLEGEACWGGGSSRVTGSDKQTPKRAEGEACSLAGVWNGPKEQEKCSWGILGKQVTFSPPGGL